MVKKQPIKNPTLEKFKGIADDTFKELINLNKSSRPEMVYLYNSNQTDLIRVLLELSSKIKRYESKNKTNLHISVYTGPPPSIPSVYSVDVGYYLGIK